MPLNYFVGSDRVSSGAMPGGPRILVVGCGAIGGVLGAHLVELEQDVTALTTNQVIADALEGAGFLVMGNDAPPPGRPTATLTELSSDVAPFDYILLTTQPPQVEEAARSSAAWLAPDGRMVCFQNGLCEERVARIVRREQVMGAVVAWGASMLEPGVYERTSAGTFVLGRLDGGPDDRAAELARLLEAIGPVTLTDNLAGARWGKLAVNCAISTLGTLGADRLGPLMRLRHVRRLALEIMTEVVHVARAEGVRLEKAPLDLEWLALTDTERTSSGSPSLVAKHALLLAVGARYRRLRSSMLAAIERGRKPAVDFLNGEITDRAARHGIDVPVNALARTLVWSVAQGEVRASRDTLRELYERTRS